MHAAAVVAEDGFGHEGGGEAFAGGDVADDVFVFLDFVGDFEKGVEFDIDFALAGGADFVVVDFGFDAGFFEGEDHFAAEVLESVGGAAGEVSAFGSVGVSGGGFAAAVPVGFFAIDAEVGAVWFIGVGELVEDEEFGFGSEEGDVSDAGGFEIFLGFDGDEAGVSAVAFSGDGVDDIAEDDGGLVLGEGVHEEGVGVRDEGHIGLIDGLESSDG